MLRLTRLDADRAALLARRVRPVRGLLAAAGGARGDRERGARGQRGPAHRLGEPHSTAPRFRGLGTNGAPPVGVPHGGGRHLRADPHSRRGDH